jgi:hypothetical protein
MIKQVFFVETRSCKHERTARHRSSVYHLSIRHGHLCILAFHSTTDCQYNDVKYYIEWIVDFVGWNGTVCLSNI